MLVFLSKAHTFVPFPHFEWVKSGRGKEIGDSQIVLLLSPCISVFPKFIKNCRFFSLIDIF